METQFGLLGPQTGHHPLRLPTSLPSRPVVLRRPTYHQRSRQRNSPVQASATSTKEPSLEVKLTIKSHVDEVMWIHILSACICHHDIVALFVGQQDPDPGQQCRAGNWHCTAREQQSTSESAEATHCHPGVWLGCYELHQRLVQERQVHSFAHQAVSSHAGQVLMNLRPAARSSDIPLIKPEVTFAHST